MPLRSRRDILGRHANLSGRVRALEVGAHPISAGLDFGASFPLTRVTEVNASWKTSYFVGASTNTTRYRKRLSVVQFYGAISGPIAAVDATGLKVGQIDPSCAPGSDMRFQAAISVMPFWMRVTVKTNGEVWLANPAGAATSGDWEVFLDHINFIAEDASG